jgi:hypothetical protein
MAPGCSMRRGRGMCPLLLPSDMKRKLNYAQPGDPFVQSILPQKTHGGKCKNGQIYGLTPLPGKYMV